MDDINLIDFNALGRQQYNMRAVSWVILAVSLAILNYERCEQNIIQMDSGKLDYFSTMKMFHICNFTHCVHATQLQFFISNENVLQPPSSYAP